MHNRLWALLAISILGIALAGDPEMYAWAARFGPYGKDAARVLAGAAGAVLLVAHMYAEQHVMEQRDGRKRWPVPLQALLFAIAVLLVLYLF
jgi:hypothetical protein